jgi:aminotransferase
MPRPISTTATRKSTIGFMSLPARIHAATRTSVFTESVIREMTRLAMIHDAINLAQGYPDFPAPAFIKQAAIDAINADVNQYAITWGSQRLRQAISAKTKRFMGLDFDPEREITVTCGATEAMMCAMLAVVEPGDEVIVFEPFYENYVPDAAMSGANLVFVTLEGPDFAIDPDALRRAFSSRTRAIIVNTPNNPSGKVFTRAELEQIAALCQEFDCLAITDEIYEHILYDDHEHVSLATLPGMYERTITISGLSKTFSVTGWRLGYVLAPAHLSEPVRKVHDFLTVGAPAPLQEAAAVAIEQSDGYYGELRGMYASKRGALHAALREAGFRCHLPAGAYYIMAGFEDLGFDGDDTAFATHLIEHVGVAAVPGSSFYRGSAGANFVRFTFSKSDETLAEAARRLQSM